MPFDFEKLTADVKAALEAGAAAAASSDDKGASNFDGTLLRIEHQQESKVIAALAKAGIDTKRSNWGWLGRGYMINPITNGQGNKRMVATTAITEHLDKAGYNVVDYRQMD